MFSPQVQAIINLLMGAASVIAPGHTATVALLNSLLAAGGKLHDLIEQIKRDDPAAWAAVSKDFSVNHAGFLASMSPEAREALAARSAGSAGKAPEPLAGATAAGGGGTARSADSPAPGAARGGSPGASGARGSGERSG